MNKTKNNQSGQFRLKKPIVIEYASAEDVAKATKEVIREHSRTIALLEKT